jgi:signal transduction histidine kinase
MSGEDDALLVRADPERLQQVLANLLDNAVKHSPTGSTIDVRVAAGEEGRAMVEVSDRGTGITEEELDRAFEKFSRGRHGTVRGTGLGLYISRMIVDAHGGRIWASRRAGGGATVAFTLPLVSAGPPEETTPAGTGLSRPPTPAVP